MAVKKNTECEIIIKVETGTTSTGKASYSSRSFGYINPSRKISFRRHQSLPFVKKYIYTEITKLGLMTRYCVDFKIQ